MVRLGWLGTYAQTQHDDHDVVVDRGEIDLVHDQELMISEARLSLDVGLARRFAASLMLPIRTVGSSIRYLDMDGNVVQLVNPNIHHRNETVSGIGDPMLLGSTSVSVAGWRLTARAGLTVPIGRTEENPFELGDMGLRHQHIQMGTGTVNPVVAVEVARSWGRWRAVYHGVTSWSESRSFDALLAVPPALRPAVEPHLVRFEYVLHDLSRISDDELHRGARLTALAKLVTMLFKYGRTRADLIQILGRWMDVMRNVVGAANGLEALARVVRYILEVNEHVGAEALQALLEREIGPEAKDTIVTAAQQLIQQGRQEGRREGEARALLRLARQRFGDAVDSQIERRIATASIEQLEVWSERGLTAATLAELLAD